MSKKPNKKDIPNTAAWAYHDLLCYVLGMMPTYRIGDHHRTIAKKLMAVERGGCKRLMIFVNG